VEVRTSAHDSAVPVGRAVLTSRRAADADPTETARTLLAAQQGLAFMGRTGLDLDELAATARSLVAQLLPDASPRWDPVQA
jgi:hypothetical protein